MKKIYFWTLLTLTCFSGIAQTKKEFFKHRDFGKYFLSDRYAPITKVNGGGMMLWNDYEIEPKNKKVALAAELVVGSELPILYSEKKASKWSLSIPVSISVWNDFTEERTSPVLNTDYRFAVVEFNYLKRLSGRIKNIGLKVIPFFHESTHIGDELILAKFRDTFLAARINVSYETFEIAATINDPQEAIEKNHSLRVGAKFLWKPKKGYYTADTLEVSPGLKISSSKRWIEPYLQYQYQDPNFLSGKSKIFIFSQDLYMRVRYGYPYTTRDDMGTITLIQSDEQYTLCSNTMIGWKFLTKNQTLSNMGVFLNIYLGINPHGQFRNIPRYHWGALSFTYDF